MKDRDRVLEIVLAEGVPLKAVDIEECSAVPLYRVRESLKELVIEGVVFREKDEGGTYYQLTDLGRSLMDQGVRIAEELAGHLVSTGAARFNMLVLIGERKVWVEAAYKEE